MLTFAVVACFVILLWIAVALCRILLVIDQIRAQCAGDAYRTDLDYPAFPRGQINHASQQKKIATSDALASQERLYTLPQWKDIAAGKFLGSAMAACLGVALYAAQVLLSRFWLRRFCLVRLSGFGARCHTGANSDGQQKVDLAGYGPIRRRTA